VSANAARQIRKAAKWWHTNRPAVPDLLGREVERGFDLISTDHYAGALSQPLSRDSLEGSAEAWVRDLSLPAPGKRDLVKECRDRVGIGGRFAEHPQPKLREVTLVQSQKLQICPGAVHSPTFALKKRMAPNLPVEWSKEDSA
jgi:hypothetical protein